MALFQRAVHRPVYLREPIVTDVPHIDLVVVLLLLHHFWGGVEGSAAACLAHKGRVDGPSEVTHLDDVLREGGVLRGRGCSPA